MRVAIISDIHGNAHALEAVLEDAVQQKADKYIVLGDLVFKGALPERCVEIVQKLNAPVLRGNIDELVGTGRIQPSFAKSPEHEAALLEEMAWNRERLSHEQLTYLAELPMLLEFSLSDDTIIRCFHATPSDILHNVLPTETDEMLLSLFGSSEARIAAYGHIHTPYIRCFEGRMLVNPGSVGLPFDGDPRASYALLDLEEHGARNAILRRVTYDLDSAVQAFIGTKHPQADSVIAALRAGRRPS